MNNLELVKNDFFEFLKQYMRINGNPLNDELLAKLKEMQNMYKQGYKLKYISTRRGHQLIWYK